MEAAARIQFLRDWSLVSMAGRPAVLPEYGRRGVTHKEAGPHVSKGLFYPRDTLCRVTWLLRPVWQDVF